MNKNKSEKTWEDCICGVKNCAEHSIECKANHRKNRSKRNVKRNRDKRHQRREEHKCTICGEEVTPIIHYPQFCKSHKKQQAEYNKSWQKKK